MSEHAGEAGGTEPADEVTQLEKRLALLESTRSRWWQAFHILAESEKRLRSLLWHSTTLLAMLDRDGTILYVSPVCERMLGYRPDELAGNNLFTIVHPQDAAEVREWLAGAAHTPETMTPSDCRARHRDGSWRVLAIAGGTITDDVTPEGVVFSARDVTAQRHAEREQRFLASIIEATPNSVIGEALDGTILSWNQGAEMTFGYGAEEALGQPISMLYPPGRESELGWIMDTIRRGEDIAGHETQRMRKDGSIIEVALTISPVVDESGSLIGMATLALDLTHLKAAEQEIRDLNAELEKRVARRTEQLEAANRELEAFAYSVSHDLRAPLRAMDGFSRILMNEYAEDLPERATHYLGRIRENAQEMGDLIAGLLAFSRLTREALHVQTVDPAAIARRALDTLADELEGREIAIHVEDMPPCEADPRLLQQVFANLLENALKYTRTRSKAQIRVGAADHDGQAAYVVEDNGVGFDMAYADKLFGVFQRLHRAEEFEGTGIGLAIVQRIVRRHGGRVWAEAEKGEGAAFYFTLGRDRKE